MVCDTKNNNKPKPRRKKIIKIIKKVKKKNKINNGEIINEKNNEIKMLDIDENKIKSSQIDEDSLQDMEYEEAIIYDKRSYLKMYWSYLVDSQIILATFFTENNLNLLIIKINLVILNLTYLAYY